MIKIGITGEKGFVGQNLVSYLSRYHLADYIPLGRDYLESVDKLASLDVLIHAAAVFRDAQNSDEVYNKNKKIDLDLISCLEQNSIKVNIVFLSSVHESNQSAYGRSKLTGKILFERYCNLAGTNFLVYKLPNLFGAFAKVNSTSFVATFAYNIWNDLPTQIENRLIRLAYIEDFLSVLLMFDKNNLDIPTIQIEIVEVYRLFCYFKNQDLLKLTPLLKNTFEENMFYTFKYYKEL